MSICKFSKKYLFYSPGSQQSNAPKRFSKFDQNHIWYTYMYGTINGPKSKLARKSAFTVEFQKTVWRNWFLKAWGMLMQVVHYLKNRKLFSWSGAFISNGVKNWKLWELSLFISHHGKFENFPIFKFLGEQILNTKMGCVNKLTISHH